MAVDRELHFEIEQFLYREARLLDDGRFHDWLALFTDDARYFVPVRQAIQQRSEGFREEDEFAVADFVHQRGMKLDVWTLDAVTPNWQERLHRAVAAGVDMVTTNTAAELAQA